MVKPWGAITAAMNKAMKYAICLHPDASSQTCSKIILAHTLQRSRVLNAIAERQHVYTFFPIKMDEEGEIALQSRGCRGASTFTAFCSTHDNLTFAPLEKVTFSGAKEQIFLIAYRAICWEFYQKITSLKGMAEAKKQVDDGKPIETQLTVQSYLQAYETAFKQGYNEIEAVKAIMDMALKTKDYSTLAAYEIVMTGPLSIAATGAINPDWSLENKRLQIITDSKRNEWLAFGVNIDIRNNNISVVFLWSRTESAPQQYMNSVHALDDQQLAEFLVQFFFTYCENTYFAKSWWDSLDEEQRSLLYTLMRKDAYASQPQYNFSRSMAPWKIIDRRWL